jgi:hypothetical protein
MFQDAPQHLYLIFIHGFQLIVCEHLVDVQDHDKISVLFSHALDEVEVETSADVG